MTPVASQLKEHVIHTVGLSFHINGGSECRLYDAPHEFNLDMAAEVSEWLRCWV